MSRSQRKTPASPSLVGRFNHLLNTIPTWLYIYLVGVLGIMLLTCMVMLAALLSRLGMVHSEVLAEVAPPPADRAQAAAEPTPLIDDMQPPPQPPIAHRETPQQVAAFPPEVVQTMVRIHQRGELRGNQANVFSKIGDSITESRLFFRPIGEGTYDLGPHSYLQPVIDHYSTPNARQGNAFTNPSLAATTGWSAWAVLDADFADPQHCLGGETPLVCEYRLNRPTVALIMLGSNDVSYRPVEGYRTDMVEIIAISEEMGVIPVLSTIPRQPEAGDAVEAYNAVIREMAAEYALPLWDYAAAMEALPNYGLSEDGVHPSGPPTYDMAAVFTEENLRYGYVMRNLSGLEILHRVWAHLELITQQN